MKVHETFTRIIDSAKDGKYKLTMAREHDRTIIHVKPILEKINSSKPTPIPAPTTDEWLPFWLAIAIGIAVLIFILAVLLLFCCCCSACPIYEWRRRRRKKQRERAAALAWRHKSAQFTTPMFETPKSVEANGKVPLLTDIEKGKTSAFESAHPPVNNNDVGQQTAHRFESSAPPTGWGDRKEPPTPSIFTTSDLNTSRSPSEMAMHSTDFHMLHRKSNTMSMSTRGGTWEVEPLHSASRLKESSWVDSCVLTADNFHLLTGSTHGPPCLWDLQTGTLLHALEGFDAASGGLILAAGDRVLVAMVEEHNMDGTRMQMWDMSTSSRVHMSFPLFVSAMCPLRSRPQVVLAQYDPESDANPALVVWDVLANEEVSVIPFQHPLGMSSEGGLTFVKVTFDDRFALTGFTNQKTHESCFMVFDLEANHGDRILDPLVIPLEARLECTVVSPGRPEAVTGTRDGQIMVWNLLNGLPMRQLLESAVEHHSPGVNSSAVTMDEIIVLVNSYDGHLMVSGDSSGIVHFWNGHSERWIATVHMPLLSAVAISRDSSIVATGASHGVIHLWRGSSGHPVAKVSTSLDIVSLVLSNDKSAIVALGNNANQHERGMMILRLSRGHARPSVSSSNAMMRSSSSLRR